MQGVPPPPSTVASFPTRIHTTRRLPSTARPTPSPTSGEHTEQCTHSHSWQHGKTQDQVRVTVIHYTNTFCSPGLSTPADTNTVPLHTGVRPYRQHRRSDPPLPLTFPDAPTFFLVCTWSSRDALTTSSSLKHATVNSFDMTAHCRPSEQVTTHADCYDTSLVDKAAECTTLVARISTVIGVTIATCGLFTHCTGRHFEQCCGRVTKMAYYGQQGYGNPNPGYGQPPPQAPQQDFLWSVFQKYV